MQKQLISLVKIESMSSLEIAELTGKRHGNVLRDIRAIVDGLKDDPELSHELKQQVIFETDERGYDRIATLSKTYTLVLTAGYSIRQRTAIIKRLQYLEDQLEIVKFRQGDKKHQLDAMEALSHLLPEDLQGEALNYIKANTVVNKAVSNLFGFPKMLKKDEMSQDMLIVRENILDDYIKLYEVIEDNGKIKEILYGKYQPKRLENNSVSTVPPLSLVS